MHTMTTTNGSNDRPLYVDRKEVQFFAISFVIMNALSLMVILYLKMSLNVFFLYNTLLVYNGVQGAQPVSCKCNPCHQMMSCGLSFRIW